MIVECPECKSRYKIDPAKSRKTSARIKCPGCSIIFSVDLVPAAPEAPPAGATARKILVVDDSRFFRRMIVDMLTSLEVECLTAADSQEALRLIRDERPALVLLDLNMPGKSGYDLIREVRADANIGDTPLLAMSGVFRKETDVEEVIRAGADDFINKSFKPEQLQQRVSSMLQA